MLGQYKQKPQTSRTLAHFFELHPTYQATDRCTNVGSATGHQDLFENSDSFLG